MSRIVFIIVLIILVSGMLSFEFEQDEISYNRVKDVISKIFLVVGLLCILALFALLIVFCYSKL